MRYFGPPGDAPVYEGTDRATTPVGEKCFSCHVAIKLGDQGFLIPNVSKATVRDDGSFEELPWHRRCLMENVLGPMAGQILERADDTAPRKPPRP